MLSINPGLTSYTASTLMYYFYYTFSVPLPIPLRDHPFYLLKQVKTQWIWYAKFSICLGKEKAESVGYREIWAHLLNLSYVISEKLISCSESLLSFLQKEVRIFFLFYKIITKIRRVFLFMNQILMASGYINDIPCITLYSAYI